MALVYGSGFARFHEDRELEERFGHAWVVYRRHVRRWLPRFRPWHPATAEPDELRPLLPPPEARLYVALSCTPCSQVARFFQRRNAAALAIVAAEEHPVRDLSRLTYEPGDGGPEDEGVRALARGLEHVHLGWAVVGFAMRLPGVAWLLQLVADGVGGGPMVVARRQG
jgi:hypothetical protein